MTPPSRRPADATALARIEARLNRAARPPWLHGEVARRMAQRLPLIRLRPACVIDWGAFLGASRTLLQAAYPEARLVAVEHDAQRRDASAATWAPRGWTRRWRQMPEVLMAPALGEAEGQLLWANMALHRVADPTPVMAQWQRALAIDGCLMFSTLGAGTLRGLSELYADAGWPPPFAAFVDMHDLGDMLVAAGFADPVMDQETLTLNWADAGAALAELRQLGGNADPLRHAGLRTPRWRARWLDLLVARTGADGRPRLEFEIVYGHAFKAAPRHAVSAQTSVPLEDMQSMVRRRRPQP